METFDYGKSHAEELAKERPPLPTVVETFHGFELWNSAIHKTGYMEDLSRSPGLLKPHSRDASGEDTGAESHGFDWSDMESSSEQDESDEESGSDDGVDTNQRATRKSSLTPDEEVMRKAFDLFGLGLRAPAHNMSSQYALLSTPAEFKKHGIELMAHQKSEAGRLIRMVLGEAVSANESNSDGEKSQEPVNADPVGVMNGLIVDFEMGLGKTYIIIGK